MHKSATKCNKTLSKWCKNKHGASKIIDTFWMYQVVTNMGPSTEKIPSIERFETSLHKDSLKTAT
jgi:hypothetical protein